MKKMFILLPFALLLASSAPAGDPKWQCRIQVSVSGDQKITASVTSFLKRELRSLGDVTIVEESPDYICQVVTFADRLSTGAEARYTLSVLIQKPFQTSNL